MTPRTTLRSRFVRRRHTALLVALVVAMCARPLIGDAGIGPVMFSLAMMALLLVALYTLQVDELVGDHEVLIAERRRRGLVGGTLAVMAIAERVSMMVAPNPRIFLVGSLAWLAFFVFVTWHQFRSVLRQKEVTGETLSLAISVYLLLGLTWGLVYIVLFQCQEDAFSFGSGSVMSVEPSRHQHLVFPVLIYFSLTTLATIGYGDITPLTLQARYAAVAEGITGQLYLAILVARLVGLHMNQSARDASS